MVGNRCHIFDNYASAYNNCATIADITI